MSDDRPIGETIEQRIRELGEEIRELRRKCDAFRKEFLELIEKNNQMILESEKMIERNNQCLKKST